MELFSFSVAVIAALLGIAAILGFSLGFRKRYRKSNISIRMHTGQKYELPPDIPKEDLDRLIEKISSDSEIVITKPKKNTLTDDAGIVLIDFFLFIVPAIIALLFAGTFAYLLIAHQNNPDYATPKELSAAMTTIIGYFFGVGATTAANKGKTLTMEEIRGMIGVN
jgi:hypothetical protein